MTEKIRAALKARQKTKKLPEFKPGDTVSVYVKVREGEKERTQAFRGLVLKMQGMGTGRSFTVRKVSFGVGVERTFPFSSPSIERIELISTGKVRRAKLYYLRDLKGRAANVESNMVVEGDDEAVGVAAPADATSAAAAPVAEKAKAKKEKASAPAKK